MDDMLMLKQFHEELWLELARTGEGIQGKIDLFSGPGEKMYKTNCKKIKRYMNIAKWYACYACEASALFSLLGIFDGQHCTDCPIEWSKENGKNRFACERGRGSLYKKWEEEEDILARKMYALQIAFLWK